MQRFSIRLPRQQLAEIDDLVEAGEFPNRSEAVRAAIRRYLNEEDEETGGKPWSKV